MNQFQIHIRTTKSNPNNELISREINVTMLDRNYTESKTHVTSIDENTEIYTITFYTQYKVNEEKIERLFQHFNKIINK